jgi:hypothetical protein
MLPAARRAVYCPSECIIGKESLLEGALPLSREGTTAKMSMARTPMCQPALHCTEKPHTASALQYPSRALDWQNLTWSQLAEEKCSLLPSPAPVSQSRAKKGELGAKR